MDTKTPVDMELLRGAIILITYGYFEVDGTQPLRYLHI